MRRQAKRWKLELEKKDAENQAAGARTRSGADESASSTVASVTTRSKTFAA